MALPLPAGPAASFIWVAACLACAGGVQPGPVLSLVHAEPVERRAERIGASRELPLRSAARVLSAEEISEFQRALLQGQLARLLAQIGQIALDGGAAEQLATPLERFPEPALGLGQPLQRVLGSIGVEVLERLLERLRRSRSSGVSARSI